MTVTREGHFHNSHAASTASVRLWGSLVHHVEHEDSVEQPAALSASEAYDPGAVSNWLFKSSSTSAD
jgi:hypothetical protein